MTPVSQAAATAGGAAVVRSRRGGPAARAAGLLLLLAGLGALPLVLANPTYTAIAVFTLIYMTAATSWNTFAGYSGYIPLGHVVFFGSGAYTLAVAAQDWHMVGGYGVFLLVPLGGVVAGVLALPFGLVALRTRRHTFVVITIAIMFIFQLLAFNLSVTNGSSGIQIPTPLWPAATFNDPFYYITLGILLLAVATSWFVRRSRFGLQLLAIRDDEDRARGLGVRTGRVKLTAFVISAIPVGMVGAMYAYFIGQIFPQFAFDPLFDVSVALMTFFGGLGTIAGPLLGAALLEPLQQYLTLQFSIGDLYLIIYGVVFLAVILAMPRGIVPSTRDWLRARRAGRPSGPAAEEDADLGVEAPAATGSRT